MHAGRSTAAAVPDALLRPAYWLVSGLEWPADQEIAEAAVVLAPGLIPRDAISYDAHQILGCADLYAGNQRSQVIFVSDLTWMFADAGTSWPALGVDWEAVLEELRDGPFPAMFLTISQRAHLLICIPASHMQPPTGADSPHDERELVRQTITLQLTVDWPPYMQSVIEGGGVRILG